MCISGHRQSTLLRILSTAGKQTCQGTDVARPKRHGIPGPRARLPGFDDTGNFTILRTSCFVTLRYAVCVREQQEQQKPEDLENGLH